MKSPSKRLGSLATRRGRADEIFARLERQTPEPKTELVFTTPFQLLVSVVLSAQTTDKSVNNCMAPLYAQGFTPETVIAWGEQAFLKKIRTIGLAPTKAKHITRLAQLVLERHGGGVPKTREELEALPGVGKKTASVILAELYQAPELAVDTHVFRVSKRLGLQAETTAVKAQRVLEDVVALRWRPKAHHWLILHGRYTCKALRPLCSHCVLADLCPAKTTFSLPNKAIDRSPRRPLQIASGSVLSTTSRLR